MAVEEVACPYCGEVTLATIGRDSEILKLRKKKSGFGFFENTDRVVKAGCSECNASFYVKHG